MASCMAFWWALAAPLAAASPSMADTVADGAIVAVAAVAVAAVAS